MSLNWKMPEDFLNNKKHLMYKDIKEDGSCSMQVELECLIFSTMHIQHNLTGEMTEDVLIEIERRLNLLKGIGCLMSYSLYDGENHRTVYTNLESVIRYWGLDTNVSHLSRTAWNKRFIKMSEIRPYEFKYTVQEAKENIAKFDITQADRIYQEMLDAKAKAKALDTPPTESA
jgi:hypothetical protein